MSYNIQHKYNTGTDLLDYFHKWVKQKYLSIFYFLYNSLVLYFLETVLLREVETEVTVGDLSSEMLPVIMLVIKAKTRIM